MLEVGVVVLMGVTALFVIHSRFLRLSVIYFAVFSLLGALLYLLYSAPELAIAEAVIGSGLLTLLYLTAIKRYLVYSVCVVSSEREGKRDRRVRQVRKNRVVRDIRQFCLRREFETQLVFSSEPLERAVRSARYNLVVRVDEEQVTIYGSPEDSLVLELKVMFEMRGAGVGGRPAVTFEWRPEA